MSNIVNKLYQNNTIIYKVILFLITTIAIVYLFPKGGHFKYDFGNGQLWKYDNLSAPFDFAVQKTEEEIIIEKKKIEVNSKHFFLYNSQAFTDVNLTFKRRISSLVVSDSLSINEINNLVLFNKIWKHRMVSVGILTKKKAINCGLTGVLLRSTGLKNDLRLNIGDTYSNYYYLNFNSYTGYNGDTYDRYLIRINEINESLNIVNDILGYFKNENLNDYKDFFSFFEKKWKKNPYKNMESLIKHFKYWSEGIKIQKSVIYSAVESPKGEFGVLLVSDNFKPYRCKIRAPGFYHLQGLDLMAKGHLLADVVTIIGTQDIVFGEVDR